MKNQIRGGMFMLGILGGICLVEAQDGPETDVNEKREDTVNPQNATSLLQTELVRKDLALTDEQVTQINLARQMLAAALQEWGNAMFRKKNRGNSYQPLENVEGKALEEITASSQRQLREILHHSQFARLQEVLVQSYGPYVFESPEVAERLGISHEQEQEITSILSDTRQECSKVVVDLGLNIPQEVTEERAALWQTSAQREWAIERDALDRIARLLSPWQRRQLSQMEGRRIDTMKLRQQQTAEFLRAGL